jgi:hypothetical protein
MIDIGVTSYLIILNQEQSLCSATESKQGDWGERCVSDMPCTKSVFALLLFSVLASLHYAKISI